MKQNDEQAITKYIDMLDGEDSDLSNTKLINELRGLTDAELADLGYQTYAMCDELWRNVNKALKFNTICGEILKAREDARRCADLRQTGYMVKEA